MVSATTTARADAPIIETKTWRDSITRPRIFSVFFILIGLWMVLSVTSNYGADADLSGLDVNEAGRVITTLTFNATQSLTIDTVTYATVVGIVFYILGGVVGLLPRPAGELGQRLDRVTKYWLFVNGILFIPTIMIIAAAGNSTNFTVLLQTSMRLATPIVIGALSGIWAERSGVVNIAIEGMMLTGAGVGFVVFTLVAGTVPTSTGLWLGVLAAVLSGGFMAALHAWLSITFRTDQIVSGTVINIMALGLTSFLRRQVLLSSEAGRETLQQIRIPVLADIPILGEIFFNGKPIFYAMFILLIATHIILFYTRWGLRTRAVGENPHAADTLGINVLRNRWINVLISGLIAGLGGAWFSLETNGSFEDGMTSGRGFIGLAAMIFGKWMPFGAFGGGVLFGFSDALGLRFQILNVNIPEQFLQMTPFVVTMVVLAGLVGKATPPKADGIPYEKE
ncbi:MAG: ABC transporter permease [Chloroflexi bacterium]|nr:MAG: ABC transporter permease [Chloroflexota bacterium]